MEARTDVLPVRVPKVAQLQRATFRTSRLLEPCRHERHRHACHQAQAAVRPLREQSRVGGPVDRKICLRRQADGERAQREHRMRQMTEEQRLGRRYARPLGRQDK